ncbi:hypothetical protein JOB18_018490, partial [Solea senegalensis]
MNRQVQRLTDFIKPSTPTTATYNKIHNNTTRWMQNTMLILQDHYHTTITSLLSTPLNPLALQIATGWARKRYGPRLMQQTLHSVHQQLQSLPQQTRTTLHTAPPPQHRSRNNLDLTLFTIPEEDSHFPNLPPSQAPQRLTIYQGTNSTTGNSPSTPTYASRQPSRTPPMTDFFPPSHKPVQKPARRTGPIIPPHRQNHLITRQPTPEPTTHIINPAIEPNPAPATSTPLPQRTKKVTWGPVSTRTDITTTAPASPISPIFPLTPPTTSQPKSPITQPPFTPANIKNTQLEVKVQIHTPKPPARKPTQAPELLSISLNSTTNVSTIISDNISPFSSQIDDADVPDQSAVQLSPPPLKNTHVEQATMTTGSVEVYSDQNAPTEPSTHLPRGTTLPAEEVRDAGSSAPPVPHDSVPPSSPPPSPHPNPVITPPPAPCPPMASSPLLDHPTFPLTPPAAASSLHRPNYHIARPNRKIQDWSFKPRRPILILGDSNINRIPAHTNPLIQLDSYPGANTYHFLKICEKTIPNPDTKIVIIAIGINNKDQDPRQTSIKQFKALFRLLKSVFPTADIYFPVINFSPNLTPTQQNNITTINNNMTPASSPDLGWNSSNNICNLSTLFTPSQIQLQLLERGLSFIPRPTTYDWEELQRDLHKYHRRIKLLDYFHPHSDFTPSQFSHPSHWEPDWTTLNNKTHTLIHTDRKSLQRFRPPTDVPDNLSEAERKALTILKNNPNIIIKPADKGSKIVIMDRQQYRTEAYRQLHNTLYYKPLDSSIQPQTQTKLRTIIQTLYNKKFISSKQRFYLFGPEHPRPRYFYLLPKIHKEPQTWTIPFEVPPGRPIVSDCNSTTYKITEYIDHFLGPLSTTHPSYIKDTYHFLDIVRSMAVPHQAHLFTIDISNLYTNINTTLGLQVISSIFKKHPDKDRPDSELLQLLELCLNNNDFLFNNQFYLQVHGTAMGQRFAPSYANIYMSEWEREALAKCPLQPTIYLRFLDDIFGIWPHDITHFPEFINILNNHHSSIKITHTLDPHTVNFLDTTIFFRTINTTYKTIETKVYFKPTDTHALLHKSSYHPKHTFKGIVKSQIIRFHRICSMSPDFHQATSTLFHSLRKRGYSKRFLRTIKSTTLASLAPARSTHPPQVTGSGLPPPPPPKPNPLPPPYPTPIPHPNPNLNPGTGMGEGGLYPNPLPHPNPNPDPWAEAGEG